MPYLFIEDFKLGMDRRKSRVNGVPGSLWLAKDCHITRGGELERRKKFVSKYTLPAGTKGLAVEGGQLCVFGETAEPAGMPAGVNYRRLQHPSSSALSSVLDWETFDGNLYTVAQFADGNIYHYYDGARVTSWDTVSGSLSSLDDIADALAARIDALSQVSASAAGSVITVTAAVAGTGFTISASATNNGSVNDQAATVATVTANGAPRAEVLAAGTFNVTGGTTLVRASVTYVFSGSSGSIDDITIAGASVVSGATNFNTTINQTMLDLAGNLNLPAGYTSSINASAGELTISAPILNNTTYNGVATTASATGGMTASPTSTTFSGASGGGISSVKVDGVEVMNSTISWGTSNSATAAAIASAIGSYTSSPEYAGSSSGPEVTVTAAAGSGSGPNGYALAVTTFGDVTVGSIQNLSGGVDQDSPSAQVNSVTLSGTFEAADEFTVTVDGNEFVASGAAVGIGTAVLTYKNKVLSTAGNILFFSAIDAPTQWGSGVGSGYINVPNLTGGDDVLTAVAPYLGSLAVFAEDGIWVYAFDADPANNALEQPLENTGTKSPRSVVTYGANDVFYLDATGVRSLRARDSSNSANMSDVGTPIDGALIEYLDTLTDTQVRAAKAVIEPSSGNYWLAVGERIYVFCHFPGAKISGWTYYDVGMSIDEIVRLGSDVYLRSGNVIYRYGGDSGEVYPDAGSDTVDIITPFMHAGTPATMKQITGIDLACEGVWRVDLISDLRDPDDTTAHQQVANVTRTTFGQDRFDVEAQATHMALRLRCSAAGFAKVSAAVIHYENGEAG